MSSPTIAETVAYLNEAGQPLMAIVVANIADSEKRCRKAMQDNLKAYYDLLEKYEPRRAAEPYVNWTGD